MTLSYHTHGGIVSMDARFPYRALLTVLVLLSLLATMGARYETENFTVENAPTMELAKEFCETAERCRHEMALLWLGKLLPNWSERCPIQVIVGDQLGAGGSTTFIFQGGEVYGWEMEIQGSAERILDCVLPHEVTHMILASHFRRPVPRWIDEGAATSVEHESEKVNYRNMTRHFLRKDVRKCLPFNRMVALKEYPQEVMPFYAQGFSVVEYLLLIGDHRQLVRFTESGMNSKDWNSALREHYGFENLGDLQANYWVHWVSAGSPTSLPAELRPNGRQMEPEIALATAVVAQPAPAYGQTSRESFVRPIPSQWSDSNSRVVPIPSVYEQPPQALLPSATVNPLDQWEGVEQTVSRPEMLIDSSHQKTVIR